MVVATPDASSIVREAAALGVQLWVEGDKVVGDPSSKVTPLLDWVIEQHKPLVLEYLGTVDGVLWRCGQAGVELRLVQRKQGWSFTVHSTAPIPPDLRTDLKANAAVITAELVKFQVCASDTCSESVWIYVADSTGTDLMPLCQNHHRKLATGKDKVNT